MLRGSKPILGTIVPKLSNEPAIVERRQNCKVYWILPIKHYLSVPMRHKNQIMFNERGAVMFGPKWVIDDTFEEVEKKFVLLEV
jgi:hypothetical protein